MKKLEILLIVFVSIFITYKCTNMTKKNNSNIEYSNQGMLYNTFNNEKKEVVKATTEDIKSDTSTEKQTTPVIKKTEEKKVEKKEVKQDLKPEVKNDSIESIVGTMSGYGHDCYGCTSNRTASGYNIETATIYHDNTYGDIRILSADKKYPFGTIVKISNYDKLPTFYAIVLDRGGSVGLDKDINFDLLYASNNDALALGIQYNVKFDIIRMGY